MRPRLPGNAPRLTVHRGSVLASGYWVRASEESLARRHVLEVWENGCEVRRVLSGYVLVLRRERRVRAQLGALAPLVRQGNCLTSAPLGGRELAALQPSSLALVSGGVTLGFELEQLEKVDPEAWLDVSTFALRNGTALGELARPLSALSKPADAQALFDESAGRSADDKARRAELLQALQQVGQAAGSTKARLGQGVGRIALDVLRGLAKWLTQPKAPAANGSQSLAKPAAPSLGPWQRLKAAFANWLSSTRLAAFVGRKHAEYLRELFDLLSQGNDEEVLRRAIPLGKGEAGAGTPALLPPSPRESFAISLGPARVSSSLGLVTDLYERLRRSYEAVFECLDAAGKHEQAAYLAEILGEAERAVAYLERHGERVLAAKLAEARQLAPGLVVRQWFLAGDRERAILIAVREGAFSDAILRLEEGGQKEEAAALRLLQAERMANAGLFVRAAELAHRMDHGRALALRWLELARAAGDLRGIPLELSLDASRFEVAQAALAPLLEAGPEQLPTLLHVGEEFARLNVQAGKPLARELSRELLAIASSTGMARVATASARVASFVGGAFKADQPRHTVFERPLGGSLRRYDYAASDAGGAPVSDVHRFGSRLLVALGEAGVVLLDGQGRRVAHFERPAHALVTSPDGSRALCVARRGDRLEVGRIDLSTRRSERWCELEAASFARQFDGETWLVCAGGWTQRPQEAELLQLDVLDETPRVLRRLPMPLDGPDIHADVRYVNVVGSEPFGSPERLRYELPQLTLRQRSVLVQFGQDAKESPFSGAAAAHGDTAAGVFERWANVAPRLSFGDRSIKLPGDDLEGRAQLTLHGDFYALSLVSEARTRVLIGAASVPEPYLDLHLHGAQQSALRFCGELLLLGDSAGRVIGVEPSTGSLTHDLRV